MKQVYIVETEWLTIEHNEEVRHLVTRAFSSKQKASEYCLDRRENNTDETKTFFWYPLEVK